MVQKLSHHDTMIPLLFADVGFDFWSDIRIGGTVDIMIPPYKEGFPNVLRYNSDQNYLL